MHLADDCTADHEHGDHAQREDVAARQFQLGEHFHGDVVHVTTPAVLWDKKIILSNGEIKPGIRTPNVMLGTIKK